MSRTLVMCLAAAGLLASGCGQQPSVPPTQSRDALVGCSPAQSKTAVRQARAVPVEVDLDGNGSPDRARLTRDDAACPGVLFAAVGDRLVSVRLPETGVTPDSAVRVRLPGRKGDLLALRAEHPRGGFQVHIYGLDGDLGEVTTGGRPVVPFVATDTRGGYLSVSCADGALVVREAVAHEPPGIVFAWDVRETPYVVDGLRVTRGPTGEIADNVLERNLGSRFPDVKHRRMFAKGCSA